MKKIFISIILASLLLALVSCASPQIFSSEDYSCKLYTLGGTLTKIAVTDADGEKQNLRADGDRVAGNSISDFELIDLNFDGHDDIRFISYVSSVGNYYTCYIYEPISGAFTKNATLNSLLSPTVDPEARTISSHNYTKIIEPATKDTPAATIIKSDVEVYAWVNQRFTAISGESITYYSENDIYRVSTLEPNEDGQLESIRDRWLSPEQYARAGYEPLT